MRLTKMKKVLATLLAAGMLMPLAACTGGDAPAETETLGKTEAVTVSPVDEETTVSETVTETAPTETAACDFRVTAYVLAGDISDYGLSVLDAGHLTKITDIILLNGADFDMRGNVVQSETQLQAVQGLKEMIGDLPVRLHLGLGGPSVPSSYAYALRREKLVTNIQELLVANQADGVSFDWEFPENITQKEAFSEFLISLDRVLGDAYMISAAIAPYCADYPIEGIRALDMVELMSYDLWDNDRMHASVQTAKQNVQTLLDLGYAPEQIDLGVPLYARPMSGAAYWFSYKYYYNQLDERGLYDDVDTTGEIFSFNTPDMIYEKTNFAIESGLGGMMVFHYTLDTPADNEHSLFSVIKQAKDDAGIK